MSDAAIRKIEVCVPATTANLGVGFDVLGMALDFEARFTFELASELSVSGCDPAFCNEGNLVWTSYLAACEALGLESRPLAIVEDSPIPSSGGLGSSSTCVVAGIAAAQVLAGKELDRQVTLDLATRIEGHPDNVAPAVMGGLVSSFIEDDRTYTTRWACSPKLRFVCMAPPYRVLTQDARRALPQMVPTDTVSWQVGRCLSMVSALASGNPADIAACCDDRIHEPYRAPLIADYDRLRACTLDAGAIAFLISGSGATMLAIAESDASAERIADVAKREVDGLWVHIARASERGTHVSILD